MNLTFATAAELETADCNLIFPEPEILGFTGGPGTGDTALFGNQMSSVVPLDHGAFRVYLTRRFWFADRTTRMDIGCVDAASPSTWPELATNYRPLRLTGLPEGCSAAQPCVIRRDGRFELFFWIHGAGMIRYVKCVSDNGLDFRLVNLDRPCLYHPADQAVRTDSRADGLLSVKNHLRQAETGSDPARLCRKISNDATTVSYDSATGLYSMYSVMLLHSDTAPQRRVDYDNAPGWLRVIHRRTSTDGLDWSDPELVLVPEPSDRIDLQFYVLQHLRGPELIRGLAGHYPVRDQVMELEPMLSTDGVRWRRQGRPWSLRQRIPGCDWPVEMLFPGGMVESGGWIWMAATAFNFRHNQAGKLNPAAYRQESMVMRRPAARWAGLVNRRDATGEAITGAFLYEPLQLDAEVPERVEIALLSPFGNELASGGSAGPDGNIVFPDAADRALAETWVRARVRFRTTVYHLQTRRPS